MAKEYNLSLHIFRRDLRLHDNSALIAALENSEKVIPIFIFDPRQIDDQPYKSIHAIQFMCHTLAEIDKRLKRKGSQLYIFEGKAEEVIKSLVKKLNVNAIYFNRDYTPFSKLRDKSIEDFCQNNSVNVHIYADALLNEPEKILKKDNNPYIVYTSAYKFACRLPIREPIKNTFSNYYSDKISTTRYTEFNKFLKLNNDGLAVKGGRNEARRLLKEILGKTPDDYDNTRDYPGLTGTSMLSAHNKFGSISIREVYHAIAKKFSKTHTLIRELYWRDFFTHIAFHFPYVFERSFNAKFRNIAWSKNKVDFNKWYQGKTGFPIVDAGMRELNQTGYMHNRARMIVASFLCKDLHINWQWGEKYFAQQLIDYDPAVNNGNWQWAASTGCDAQPYFRIFNPWLQQKKFDADCIYIKKWLPELKSLEPADIHNPACKLSKLANYPDPIVDHKISAQQAKSLYKSAN